MTSNIEVHVSRVFTNEQMKFGNKVGIVVDKNYQINTKDRQLISAKTGFSETVFINNLDTNNVSIFSPKREISFAGHALVGASNFIHKITNKTTKYLECKKGKVKTWQENGLTWIKANLENTPPWNHEQLFDASLVEDFPIDKAYLKKHTMIWSWINQKRNTIKARTFAPDWGIPEDEANGSGSMQLAIKLNKEVEIHHGKGSFIYVKPNKNNVVELGGRVAQDENQIISI